MVLHIMMPAMKPAPAQQQEQFSSRSSNQYKQFLPRFWAFYESSAALCLCPLQEHRRSPAIGMGYKMP